MLVAAVAFLLAPPAPAPAGEWVDLLRPDRFEKVDAKWVRTNAVSLAPNKPTRLAAEPARDGPVWVNGPGGRAADLITKESFGDCELHAEFLIAKGSNAGVKFHGLYEVQILDTFGSTKKLTGNSMGGVYPRAMNTAPYKYLDDGIAPKVNAAKKPGEWQVLDVVWTAPKLDANGKKLAPGVIERATLNGHVIHDKVAVHTPTGANCVKPDTAAGPVLLQGDHGPVAFRAVRVRKR